MKQQISFETVRAAWVLADGGTQQLAAQEAGVTVRTIQNWLKTDWFAKMVADKRTELIHRANDETREATLANKSARLLKLNDLYDVLEVKVRSENLTDKSLPFVKMMLDTVKVIQREKVLPDDTDSGETVRIVFD